MLLKPGQRNHLLVVAIGKHTRYSLLFQESSNLLEEQSLDHLPLPFSPGLLIHQTLIYGALICRRLFGPGLHHGHSLLCSSGLGLSVLPCRESSDDSDTQGSEERAHRCYGPCSTSTVHPHIVASLLRQLLLVGTREPEPQEGLFS